jgi:hypothetical protein
MLHVLVNKFKYRYFKLKEEIQSPGSWHLHPFAIILSRHTSASLRLCETIFFKIIQSKQESSQRCRDAKDKKYRNDRHSSFLIENRRPYSIVVHTDSITPKKPDDLKINRHKKNRH